jgi:hypothetical protein
VGKARQFEETLSDLKVLKFDRRSHEDHARLVIVRHQSQTALSLMI